MVNLILTTGRLSLLFFSSIILIGCSYSQKAEDVNKFVNYDTFEEVNLKGYYTVILKKADSMAGEAKILSKLCSGHTFPYDFSVNFDEVVQTVSDKVYENVNMVKSDEIGEAAPQAGRITIDVGATDVKVMCFLTTPYTGDCRGITRLTGTVHVAKKGQDVREYQIAAEGNKTTSAGGFCGGTADAMSASIGGAINDFGKQLHEALTVE